MHIQKMFKRMQKKHGGPPPPGMYHGMPGMSHPMMPKPHEMLHHMMPKPHEMLHPMMPKPHEMLHHMMHKPHEMWPHMPHHKRGHHKMHPAMFHKMHHKMHKKHHHKKHHGRPSSSSSSSSSESEDESLVDGIDKVQIGDEQQGKETTGNETPAPPSEGGDVCKEKFKCKKGKNFKPKGGLKCKSSFKMTHKDGFCPYWMKFSSMREPPCRDSRYNKGSFFLPFPQIRPNTEEGRAATGQNAPEEETQVRSEEVTGQEKSQTAAGQHSLRRNQRRGDSVDYFMQSVAEQIKKLPEFKIAEAKLKILEVVNEMQMDAAPEQHTSAVDMNIENDLPQETHPETQSASLKI